MGKMACNEFNDIAIEYGHGANEFGKDETQFDKSGFQFGTMRRS